jgi:hypothetical protein
MTTRQAHWLLDWNTVQELEQLKRVKIPLLANMIAWNAKHFIFLSSLYHIQTRLFVLVLTNLYCKYEGTG